MERVYCISGLGADERLFRNLAADNCEFVPLNWVPYSESDTMSSYAGKMSALITDRDPVVLGLSFGGMLAVEIAKQRQLKKIFIVSSAKNERELGYRNPIFKWLVSILPGNLFAIPNGLVLHNLGAKTVEEKELLRDVIRVSDGRFMKWALKSLLTWAGGSRPANLVQIHGTADRVIWSRNVQPDHWIAGGTHIMIYNRAAEVSEIISDCLRS